MYFGGSFFLFGYMLNWTGLMMQGDIGNLVYLAILDVVISWIVYSLFRGGVHREAAIADVSRCDELTFSGGYTYGVPQRGEDFRIMLRRADEELLAVKHSGKKRVSGHAYVA